MTTLHFKQALLDDGWACNVRIEIAGSRIQSIARNVKPAAGDDTHAIAVPGMINLHSHAFQRGMAGLAEVRGPGTDSFWTWRETMYRFALSMSPDDVEAVAAQLYCEMLEAGFTRVGEFHYLHHSPDGTHYDDVSEMAQRVASAASEAGIGLSLLPVFYAHSTFGGAAPLVHQRRFVSSRSSFERLYVRAQETTQALENATLGLAPHSLRAVALDELEWLAGIAPLNPIHMHIAEQTKEVDDCIAWSGKRPVEWLLDRLHVDQRWCLIHATHMTDAETRALAETGAVVGLCPITEANLGDGYFPASTFVDAKGRFGVGTDSNVSIGVAEELRQLEYGQRLLLRQRNVFASRETPSTGRALFDAARRGGAQALGVSGEGIAVGADADLVTLNAAHPALLGKFGDQLLDSWIFAGGHGVVDCVYVGGTLRVRGGHVARERVTQRFAETMTKLTS